MKRIASILALTLAAVLAVTAAAVQASTDAAPMTITDAAGDAATAPDLTKVTLTPGTGTVTVDVTFTGTVGTDGTLLTLIDSDRNQQTGNDGFEYAVFADATGFALVKWDGTNFSDFTHQPPNAQLTATDLTYTLTLADLGGVQSFDFVVGAIRGDDIDAAPDNGLGTFTAAAPATLKSIQMPTGLTAHAGKVLRLPAVTVLLSDGSVADPDTETCVLTHNGTRIAPLAGGCAWKIPKAYKKARLVLTVTVAYGGKTVSKTATLVVR